MKDVQQQRVYDAEQEVRSLLRFARQADAATVRYEGMVFNAPSERVFADLTSMQTYVDRLLGLNWVKATWTRADIPITVTRRRGETKATYHHQGAEIRIPTGDGWAMREIVLLHEVAHHLTAGEKHGPLFVGTFVALVSEVIGPEAGLLLRVAMHQCGAVETPVEVQVAV